MAIDGFIELGPNIFLYTPPEAQLGELIVLCTWLDAADKHISKYTAVYIQSSPRTRILLLKSVVSKMISSYSRQQRAMEPAEVAICQVLKECDRAEAEKNIAPFTKEPRIMFRMMSNGGVNSATNLLVDMKKRLKIHFPIIGLI
jgi:hypothetical protein